MCMRQGVEVRCEARWQGRGQCTNDAAGYKYVRGQPYLLCTSHGKLPPSRLDLIPPLDFEGVQKVYRKAHPRADGKKT